MTELIEVTNIVTDTSVMELRVGDRVEMALVDGMVGTILEIAPAEGPIHEEGPGQLQVEQVPIVVVQFDDRRLEFATEFLRASIWRWQALGLRRR